jgi:hypothetical protein
MVALLSLLLTQGEEKKGNKIRVTVLGHWDVISHAVVRLDALKRSCVVLS